MSNPNQHIEDFLKYYFKLSSPPQYAVLLKGKWGVGKTWFLKEIMASLYNPDHQVKTHLYVSLYGVASFEEIENEFFRQLHPVLSSKGMALAGKIGKGLLKTVLKIDLNDDGKSDASVSSQIPDINLPDYLSNTEGLILVFDDLERASMDLENLLGYINYFVEHQGYKVVIVANEDELGNKEKTSDVSYKRIKEKLIGKTFEIQPRLDLAVNNFIKEIESQATQNLFNSNIDLIKDCYRRSGYLNLRHLRQALMDFSRLVELLSNGIKEENKVVEHLLMIYLIFSFEMKSANMMPINIKDLRGAHISALSSKYNGNEALEESNNLYISLKEKYPDFDTFDMLLEESVWIDIFDKSLINKERIEYSLKNSRYFPDENKPEWIQLWYFMRLEDEEFDSLLAIVKEQFRDKKYKELGEIKHVTGLFLELIDQGLLNITKDEVFEIAKGNIDNLIIMGKEIPCYDYIKFYDDMQAFGLSFRNEDDIEFVKLLEYITEVSKKQVVDSLPQLGNELLEDIKSDHASFHKKIYYTGSVTVYQREPVLTYIAPNEFITAFLKIESNTRKNIVLIISSRYKKVHILEILLPELDWLQKVVGLLENEAESRKGKVSEVQIRSLIDECFNPAIKTLDEAS